MHAKDTINNTSRNIPAVTRSIVLVGLMGAGKSTIGRRLAREMNMDFRDSDTEITEAAGCSISDIFDIHGEDIFRDLERRIISNLLAGAPSIIATGGGAFISPTVREMIGKSAISIWLKADLDVLLERVSRRNNRPLLEKGDKRVILGKLMEERYPIYSEADIVVESDDSSHDVVINKIFDALNDFLKKPATHA